MKYLANILLLLLSTYFTAMAAELYLAVGSHFDAHPKFNHPGMDLRTKFQVVLDERAEGREIFPAYFGVRPIEIEGKTVTPLFAGIPNKRTLYCNESGDYLIYKGDRHGFNNPDKVWDLDRIDVLMLGDSFVQGACIVSGRDMTWNLREAFPNLIALGRGGNGPLRQLALLREYGAKYKPKTVLWFYFYNDFDDLEQEKEKDFLLKYFDTNFSQSLIELSKQIEEKEVVRRNKYIEAHRDRHESHIKPKLDDFTFGDTLTFARIRKVVAKFTEKKEANTDVDTYKKILTLAEKEIASWGGEMLFVYLPAFSELTQNDLNDKNRKEAILRLISEMKINKIDLSQYFLDTGDPAALFPFRRHGHYTEEGYKLAAESVANFLRRSH